MTSLYRRLRAGIVATGIVATGIAVMALAAPGPASAQALPEAIRKQGFLRIGIEATYPPMAYKDPATNERRGVNVDLLIATAKVMDIEIRWEELSFEQLVPSINTGRIDFSGSALGDTPVRREKLTFVDYIASGAQIFTTPAQLQGATQATDFCGRSIATPRTTNYFPQIQAWSDRFCVAAGKPPMQVIGTAGAAAARTDLQQGRASAAILGAEFVTYLSQQNPGGFVAVGDRLSSSMFGMAFAQDQAPLRDAIAAALSKLVADGSYLAILTKHGLEKQALAEISIDKGE